METIKVGDNVYVSKDAPKVYQKGSIFDYTEHQSTVHEVDGDAAIIGLDIEDSPIYSAPIVIPTKYLIKVDADAKEAKFKYQVGQKAKSAYADEILTIKEFCGRVGHDNVYRVEEYPYTWNECELRPYTEPTEQTEAERKPNHTIKIPVKVDLTDNYWDAYTADLAKEVTLKIANKFNDPEQAAEYAVKVAKAVVEGLKRK